MKKPKHIPILDMDAYITNLESKKRDLEALIAELESELAERHWQDIAQFKHPQKGTKFMIVPKPPEVEP